jgi:amidohydrolase
MTTRTMLEAARAIAAEVVADRRAIHRHPELGYKEERTASLVASRLRSLGLDDVRTGVGGTGVVGLLRGELPGRTVLLRADMDALPIQEDRGLPYASEVPGVMHACGHDAHTAMLLGAARLLAERRGALRGAVKLMFQPAEENGGAGAKRMIEDGVLDDPPVDAAFAMHVARHAVGQVGLLAGPSSGSADRFIITVRGRGGHASAPHLAVDPVVVGAYIITALQTLVSREVSPGDQAVVTVGSLTAGTIFNAIPDTATLKGTFRASTREVRDHLRQRIQETAQGVATAMRATADFEDYGVGYPPVVSDAAMVEVARAAAASVVGEAGVLESQREMGGEDFSFVLERVPGAFIRLGTHDPAWGEPKPAHSPRFQLSEEALPIGVAVLAETARRYLEGA